MLTRISVIVHEDAAGLGGVDEAEPADQPWEACGGLSFFVTDVIRNEAERAVKGWVQPGGRER
jgi:hypothetical protein